MVFSIFFKYAKQLWGVGLFANPKSTKDLLSSKCTILQHLVQKKHRRISGLISQLVLTSGFAMAKVWILKHLAEGNQVRIPSDIEVHPPRMREMQRNMSDISLDVHFEHTDVI